MMSLRKVPRILLKAKKSKKIKLNKNSQQSTKRKLLNKQKMKKLFLKRLKLLFHKNNNKRMKKI